jgi:hypothetical protein
MRNVPAVFKGSTIPINNERTPNVSIRLTGYYLSYSSRTGDYGSDTTAIILNNVVHLLLNGNHTHPLWEISSEKGIDGCIEYFANNINKANKISEHYQIIGKADDLFNLTPAAIKIIGQSGIDLIANAVKTNESSTNTF